MSNAATSLSQPSTACTSQLTPEKPSRHRHTQVEEEDEEGERQLPLHWPALLSSLQPPMAAQEELTAASEAAESSVDEVSVRPAKATSSRSPHTTAL